MAWTDSRVFRAAIADLITQEVAYDLNLPSGVKTALYGGSITPDQNAARAAIAYNTGQWATAGEKVSAGQWAAGGLPIANMTVSQAAPGVVVWDGDDITSGSAATLADVNGVFNYQDNVTTPIADPGICFNYFGGPQQVTNGTFSVIWAANGIARFTV